MKLLNYSILRQAVLNKIRNPILRKYLLFIVSPKRALFKPNTFYSTDNYQKFLKDGCFVITPLISSETVEKLHDYAKNAKVYDPWTNKYYDNISLAKCNVPRVDTNLLDFDLTLNQDTIDTTIKFLENYFYGNYFIDAVEVWWSIPTNNNRREAEFFHRDGEALRILKLFVYITDVDHDSAPNHYVIGSHISSRLTSLRRYSDEEVYNNFSKIHKSVGSSGYTFIADTYGIHRGDIAIKPRLMLQIRFTSHPTLYRRNDRLTQYVRRKFN